MPPERPVYLLGESFGGVLALAVAAELPDLVDRVVLVNPATSFPRSVWPLLGPLLPSVPPDLYRAVPVLLAPVLGNPLALASFGIDPQASLPDQVLLCALSVGRAAAEGRHPAASPASACSALQCLRHSDQVQLSDTIALLSPCCADPGLLDGAAAPAAAAVSTGRHPARAHAGLEAAAAGGGLQVRWPCTRSTCLPTCACCALRHAARWPPGGSGALHGMESRARAEGAACRVVEPRLTEVQQRTLLLVSAQDLLIPSNQEGPRLKGILRRCDLRVRPPPLSCASALHHMALHALCTVCAARGASRAWPLVEAELCPEQHAAARQQQELTQWGAGVPRAHARPAAGGRHRSGGHPARGGLLRAPAYPVLARQAAGTKPPSAAPAPWNCPRASSWTSPPKGAAECSPPH